MNLNGLPRKKRADILYKEIRKFRKQGYSYSEICRFFSISKFTVHVAIKGRSKKRKKYSYPKTEKIREHDRKYQREKRAKLKGYKTEEYRKWRRKNPEAYTAHHVLNKAVKSGKIKKMPCSVCGSTVRIHGHHSDYKKPLNVIWLCPKHHKQLHQKLKRSL